MKQNHYLLPSPDLFCSLAGTKGKGGGGGSPRAFLGTLSSVV